MTFDSQSFFTSFKSIHICFILSLLFHLKEMSQSIGNPVPQRNSRWKKVFLEFSKEKDVGKEKWPEIDIFL